MKKTIGLIAGLFFLLGCAGTSPVDDVDICESFRTSITSEITVLRTEKDWEMYFLTVGGKLARNMRIGSTDCVEVNVLHAPTNQELKGYYCMEQKSDGWYTHETMCEYTGGEVTNRSINVYRKLTPNN